MFFNPQVKPKRDEDQQYLAYIRTLSCTVPTCGRKAVPHHESSLSNDPGTAMKCSDYLAVPLCNWHHTKRGNMGFETFWEAYNLDPARVVIKLLIEFIK